MRYTDLELYLILLGCCRWVCSTGADCSKAISTSSEKQSESTVLCWEHWWKDQNVPVNIFALPSFTSAGKSVAEWKWVVEDEVGWEGGEKWWDRNGDEWVWSIKAKILDHLILDPFLDLFPLCGCTWTCISFPASTRLNFWIIWIS